MCHFVHRKSHMDSPGIELGLADANDYPRQSVARLLKAEFNVQRIYITHVYKDSVWSSQRTQSAFIRNASFCMLCMETSIVYCENHTKRASTRCGENSELSVLHPLVCIVTTSL